MAMTDEEIGRLTIAEVEAISARAADALAKFAEARALLGAPIGSSEILLGGGTGGFAMAKSNPHNPANLNRRPPSTKGAELTDEERAQRDVLMAQRQSNGVGLSAAEEEEMLAQAVRR